MKVRELRLKHFKRFADQTFSFLDERGLPRDLVVLVGPNGCGKSTVLQAIAAVLGAATGRLGSPSELQWPGFDLERAGRVWDGGLEVSMGVELDAKERETAQQAFMALPTVDRHREYGDQGVTYSKQVQIELRDGRLSSDKGIGGLLALRGRLFVARGEVSQVSKLDLESTTGTTVWYTEHRSITSINLTDPAGGTATPVTLDLLRARLAQLQSFHSIVLQRRALRPGERDLYAELEQRWASVFPGRGFEGISISDQPGKVMDQAPFFLLGPDGHPYELGEMSGAERAIFPLVFDFANWNIHNSVILIDELELHLHPPLQQALLRALPRLGRNNQFIVTTHSDYIADMVPPEAVIRVGEV